MELNEDFGGFGKEGNQSSGFKDGPESRHGYLTSKGITGPRMRPIPDALQLFPDPFGELDPGPTTSEVVNFQTSESGSGRKKSHPKETADEEEN